MAEAQYPEHEKLAAISVESHSIGAFLEWLAAQGIVLRVWKEWDEEVESDFPYPHKYNVHRAEHVYIGENTEQLLARYFDIDLEKIDDEKRQMLEEMHKRNKR